jgi:phosphoglycerol transferase
VLPDDAFLKAAKVTSSREDYLTMVSDAGGDQGTPSLERPRTLVLLVVFSALSLCFIVKSLSLQYPAVIGDEYDYSILSRYFHHEDRVFAHNKVVPHLPDDLYLWMFHSSTLFGDNSYQFAKILNSLLFAAAVFPIYGISRRFVGEVPALLLSTLIIIAPLQIYTAYFMPESCYFLGFWLFAFLFLSNMPHRSLVAGILGGVTLGLLTQIKPHALAVLSGTNVTLIVIALVPQGFGLNRRDVVRCLIVLNSGWLTTVAILHIVFFGHRDVDIFGFYRRMAHFPIPDRFAYIQQMIRSLLSNIAYMAPLFGLPIVVTVASASGQLQDRSANPNAIRILSVFAIMLCAFPLLMTASATALFGFHTHHPSDWHRMLGRYYDFALPLFLIPFYAVRGKPPPAVRKLLFGGVLVCLLLVLAGWRFLASVQPVNLTDYPEMAWVTQPHNIALSIFWPTATVVLIYYAMAGLKEKTTYSIYLAAAFIAGSVLSFSAQHFFDFEQQSDQAAALVRGLFDGKERDHGLVVGSNPRIVRKCLFGIPANPAVLELPAGSVIDRSLIGNDIHWVLAFDNYDLQARSTTLLALAGIKILLLQTPPAGVSDQIRHAAK